MTPEIKAPVVTIPRDKAIRLIIIAAMGGFLLGSLVVTSKSLKKDTGGKSRHANFLDTEDAKFATEATRPKPWDEPTSPTVVEPKPKLPVDPAEFAKLMEEKYKFIPPEEPPTPAPHFTVPADPEPEADDGSVSA